MALSQVTRCVCVCPAVGARPDRCVFVFYAGRYFVLPNADEDGNQALIYYETQEARIGVPDGM